MQKLCLPQFPLSFHTVLDSVPYAPVLLQLISKFVSLLYRVYKVPEPHLLRYFILYLLHCFPTIDSLCSFSSPLPWLFTTWLTLIHPQCSALSNKCQGHGFRTHWLPSCGTEQTVLDTYSQWGSMGATQVQLSRKLFTIYLVSSLTRILLCLSPTHFTRWSLTESLEKRDTRERAKLRLKAKRNEHHFRFACGSSTVIETPLLLS